MEVSSQVHLGCNLIAKLTAMYGNKGQPGRLYRHL